MDLIICRFRLWIVFLVVGLFCTFAHSWRISQKCPHGHYYNDGCTACWCDVTTGQTKCEKLLQCSRITNHVKCPRGRRYKDTCGNDCTCYEATGAALCNEKVKCPQDLPAKVQVPTPLPTPSPSGGNNVFLQRMGIAAPYIPPIQTHPVRLHLPGPTTPSPLFRFASASTTTAKSRNYNNGFYENIAIESTPHPRVRVPTNSKSDELIIEPAIIIRKKGSNKASIVRNGNSAASITLPSSRHRYQDQPFILSKSDTNNNNKGDSNLYQSSLSKAASLAPLLLYEKQLQAIMNIRRAYSQLLRSKVNFNFQMATGNAPTALTSSPGTQSQTDHPRRFDSNYENSTILTNTTPSPPIYMTSQQPKPPPNMQVKPFQPLVWRKEIKNVLKQFSPVPPLKQLVSFVSTSTENYLRDFLNNHRPQQPIIMLPSQESTTTATISSQYSEPSQVLFQQTSPRPPPQHVVPYPFTTIAPFQENQHDPSGLPIHEVYQNHDFQTFTSTPQPPMQVLPFQGHNSYLHKTLNYPAYNQEHKKEHFPFMNELIREIARMDSTTSSPDSSVTPTFQTPGPPYAKIEEVQPLSFLPPPQPEPATPTRRTFMTAQQSRHPQPLYNQPVHPTVRVNLDKPIYVNQPSPPQQPQQLTPYQRYPQLQHQQPQHSIPATQQHRFHPPPQQYPHKATQPNFPPPLQHSSHHHFSQQRFPPPSQPLYTQQTNRRVYSIPHTHNNNKPHNIYSHQPQLQQQNYQRFQSIQRKDQQHNTQYHRPIFPQYFIPKSKPKQYRLTLKGAVRDAAVRVDDVVPRFVNKIAHEFFQKPEIYIPKIRPGKPLTLEKVVLNHKEIVPTAMSFSPTPGAPPMKLHFTPQAQWEMKEDLARQGIMLDEPLTTPLRDYVANDPNVMSMDAPVKAVQTWETHSNMGMGVVQDYPSVMGGVPVAPTSISQIIQQAAINQHDPIVFQPSPTPPPQIEQTQATLFQQQQQQGYNNNPILLPSPTPATQTTFQPQTLDQQHQELQHQILLAQRQQQLQQQDTSGSSNHNDFKFDLSDFAGFKDDDQHHIFPQELENPGVEQVVVDKYIVHDPMDPVGTLRMYTTTTIQPPTVDQSKVDLSSILTQHRRNGLAALPAHGPTLPPAVLVRHRGAPTPSTTPLPPPSPTQSSFLTSPYPGGENLFVTLINSTPQPFVTSTFAPPIENSPLVQASGTNSGIEQASNTDSLVSQIQDFLAEEMDFGARPQLNLYDMLFQHRTGNIGTTNEEETKHAKYNEDDHKQGAAYNDEQQHVQQEDPVEHHHENYDQITSETKSGENIDVDTDNVANIFSMDYKNKYNNRKPPSVIVIHVPPDHSEVGDKRRDEEEEIRGGGRTSKAKSKYYDRTTDDDDDQEDDYSVEVSTKRGLAIATTTSTTTQKSLISSAEGSDDDDEDSFSSREESSSAKRRRNRKNRKRKRRRKKKNRDKSKTEEDESEGKRQDNNDDFRGNSDRVSNIDNESDKTQDNRFSGRNKSEEEKDSINSTGSLVETTTSKVGDEKNLQGAAEAAEEKFQAELDWKSQLMANICELNPSSPLCLTYRSICLLMTSDD